MINQQCEEIEKNDLLAFAEKMHASGDLILAETSYRALLEKNSDSVSLNHVLGSVLLDQKRYEEAAWYLRKASEIDPGNAKIIYSMGQFHHRQLEHDEAQRCYESAIEIQPDLFAAYNALATIYGLHRDYYKARKYIAKAIEIKPNSSIAHFNLGILQCETGNLKDGLALLRRSICLDPTNSLVHSTLLLFLHYQPLLSKELLYEEHCEWQKKHAVSRDEPVQHRNNKDPRRRLKIGYISPDMHVHSVAYFFVSILKSHSKSEYETFCYSDSVIDDSMTATLRTLADHWRDIGLRNDEYVLQCIRDDEIDILIDLAGHTGDNRLKALSSKPAPVQVTYLGYPNTTGLDSIDYRLTDIWADPPQEKGRYYSEKLVYLPDGFLCFQAAANLPDVAPAPFNENGYITFGSFNNLQKMNINTIALWASVLNIVPNSRIVLKARGLGDKNARQRITKEFSQFGVARERIKILSYEQKITDHLMIYSLIDIALDTFPYNGTTTTCEALWMGVPVITLKGDMHLSRVGESIMQQANLIDLIAETPENYIEIVAGIAGNPDLLNHLRGNLRPHVRHSKLMDAKSFISHLELTYREMWRHYCENTSQVSQS